MIPHAMSSLWNNPRRPPEVAAFSAVLKAHRRVTDDFLDLFREHGLSEPRYDVLRILRNAGPGGLPCREVGQRLDTRVPDVTRLIDRLEAAGLVSRRRSEADRRVVRIHIERKGLELLRRLDEPVLAIHAEQFRGFTRAELRTLTALLGRLRASESEPPSPSPSPTPGSKGRTPARRTRRSKE